MPLFRKTNRSRTTCRSRRRNAISNRGRFGQYETLEDRRLLAALTVYQDLDASGDFTAGEENDSYSNGGGGATHVRNFDIPVTTDPSSAVVEIDIQTVDNNLTLQVNGQHIFNHPSAGQPNKLEMQTPSAENNLVDINGNHVHQPWLANVNGLPRLQIVVTENNVRLFGTLTNASTELIPFFVDPGSTNTPTFMTGQNTITLQNLNGPGPDGMTGGFTVTTNDIFELTTTMPMAFEDQLPTTGLDLGLSLGDAFTGGGSLRDTIGTDIGSYNAPAGAPATFTVPAGTTSAVITGIGTNSDGSDSDRDDDYQFFSIEVDLVNGLSHGLMNYDRGNVRDSYTWSDAPLGSSISTGGGTITPSATSTSQNDPTISLVGTALTIAETQTLLDTTYHVEFLSATNTSSNYLGAGFAFQALGDTMSTIPIDPNADYLVVSATDAGTGTIPEHERKGLSRIVVDLRDANGTATETASGYIGVVRGRGPNRTIAYSFENLDVSAGTGGYAGGILSSPAAILGDQTGGAVVTNSPNIYLDGSGNLIIERLNNAFVNNFQSVYNVEFYDRIMSPSVAALLGSSSATGLWDSNTGAPPQTLDFTNIPEGAQFGSLRMGQHRNGNSGDNENQGGAFMFVDLENERSSGTFFNFRIDLPDIVGWSNVDFGETFFNATSGTFISNHTTLADFTDQWGANAQLDLVNGDADLRLTSLDAQNENFQDYHTTGQVLWYGEASFTITLLDGTAYGTDTAPAGTQLTDGTTPRADDGTNINGETFFTVPSEDINTLAIDPGSLPEHYYGTFPLEISHPGIGGIPVNEVIFVTVKPVNDAPDFVVPSGDPPLVQQDTGPHTITTWANYTDNGPFPIPNVYPDNGADADPAQTILQYIVANVSNPDLFATGPSVDNSGNLTYSLAAGAFGTSTFDLQVQDTGGTANGGVDLSPIQTFTIIVNGTPIATDNDYATFEDVTISGDVITEDTGDGIDSDPDGDTLTVTAAIDSLSAPIPLNVAALLPSGALLTQNDDGTFVYNPNGAFNTLGLGDVVTDSYTYTISDGNGGTDTATVTITIVGQSDECPATGSPHVINGTSGDDRIILSVEFPGVARIEQNDQFSTLPLRSDTIFVVLGDEGADHLAIAANLQRSVLFAGGEGDDYLAGGPLADILIGGAGNDRILGGSGNDCMVGGLGNDRMDGREGDDTMYGDGPDVADADGGNDMMVGGSGNDLMHGNGGADDMAGGSGDDIIRGDAGDDQLSGESGNDALDGGLGKDFVWGRQGHDVMFGGVDEDCMFGGSGQDLLVGGSTDLDDDQLQTLLSAWNYSDYTAPSPTTPHVMADNRWSTAMGAGLGNVVDDHMDSLTSGLEADRLVVGATDSYIEYMSTGDEVV